MLISALTAAIAVHADIALKKFAVTPAKLTAAAGEKVNFIIGFDAFKNIEKWKNPEQLKENIRFIVLKRTGEDRLEIEKLKEKGFDFIITDNIDTIDISSSEIREKVKNGSSINGLIDEKVKRYIEENDLYRRN